MKKLRAKKDFLVCHLSRLKPVVFTAALVPLMTATINKLFLLEYQHLGLDK